MTQHLRLSRTPNWFLVLIDQAANSGINFLLSFVGARLLSVDDFAIFSLVFLAMLFVTGVHHSLILAPLPVLHPEQTGDEAKRYISHVRRMNLLLSAGIIVVVAALAAFLPVSLLVTMTATIALIARLTADVERRIAYCIEKIERASFGSSLQAIIIIAFATYGITTGRACQITDLLLCLFGAATTSAIWFAWIQNRAGLGSNWQGLTPDIARHWHFGSWILGATLAMWLSSQSYPFIIANQLPLREVALFAAARTILGLSHFLMQGIDSYAVPKLRRCLLHQSLTVFKQQTQKVLLGGGIALLVPIALLALWPAWFLELFYAGKYPDADWILRFLAIVYILLVGNRLLQIYLTILKEPRAGFWANVANACITILIAPFLVHHFAMVGVLCAFACNQTLALATYSYYAYRLSLRRFTNRTDN